MIINCEVCNKEFKITPSRLQKNKHHTCSNFCSGKLASELHNSKVEVKCVVCHKQIFYKLSAFKQVKNHTCSRSCSNKNKALRFKGSSNPKSLKLNEFEKIFWDKAKSYANRAAAKKIDYDLDYKFLIDLYHSQEKKCYYTDLEMILESNTSPAAYNVISLDRKNSSKGYTKDNVVFCLNSLNMFKAHHKFEDIKKVMKAIMLKEQKETMVNIQKLFPDAQLPKQSDPFSSGYDLFVHRFEDMGNFIKVYTGISIQPESGFYFMLAPRSSSYKKGITLYNNLGIIDQNYTGEIIGIFLKTDEFKNDIIKGDRLLQLIPQKLIPIELVEVQELTSTERGNNGFGSSGR